MFQVLCLSPTRELAVQIQKVVLALGDYMNVQCHSCIGKNAFLLLSHFVEAFMFLNIQPLGDRPAARYQGSPHLLKKKNIFCSVP
jgi:hypothetical protein